jgi:hypothetical protein
MLPKVTWNSILSCKPHLELTQEKRFSEVYRSYKSWEMWGDEIRR